MGNNMETCPGCKTEVEWSKVKENNYVCPNCGRLFRVWTDNRIKMTADAGSFESMFDEIGTVNVLDTPEYEEKLKKAQDQTGLKEGVTVGKCLIGGHKAVLGVIDSRFLMGSMGHAVGDRITSAVEVATEEGLPVILFCCSGGARMQEGIISLMQMEKTSAALKRHSDAGNLYISVLTDPTTGGVTASFAMLGDIILAEPGAMIGFAGPRVIEQTIGEKLPEGFQRAEFQLEHGFVDRVVERKDLKPTLVKLLEIHSKKDGFAAFTESDEKVYYGPTELMRERGAKAKTLSAWEKVQEARKVSRLGASEYIGAIFDDFIELHGDRYFRDDPAIMGGVAYLDGQPVTVIGVNRGRSFDECQKHNFGMPSPEGYRKALRLMKQAEKFGRPIITFVNTSGAYPGKEAEENGQGEAIARNLYEMSAIKVPILAIMMGEGGSGGAIALAVGNEVWMTENAIYSILSPEGFSSILWKDGSRKVEASEVMKITAQDLKKLNVIEQIIPEYGGADEDALSSMASDMKGRIREFLTGMEGKSGKELADQRYARFRKY
ncbi:MAG: acetyl-CoA carboxylase carboxyltransferase subunit alpha [Lachnospiraceae bacterium]|nr:acetyl-CoA carboxylase carboxyltransferase subunit alpha [Lachnospiraceae bacterium]